MPQRSAPGVRADELATGAATLDDHEPHDRDRERGDKLPQRDGQGVGVHLRHFRLAVPAAQATAVVDRDHDPDQIARSDQRVDQHRQTDGAQQERDATRVLSRSPRIGNANNAAQIAWCR